MTGTDPASAPVPVDDLNERDIALRFESLGGAGRGHEFGLFQRRCGAEPLGLLRWADVPVDLLSRALEKRLNGVGDEEHTIVYAPEDASEWWTRDRRYWMATRSCISTDYVSRDDMVKMACRRLGFLRDKLIEDLRAARKIFVYRSANRVLLPAEIERLHRALRLHGGGTLLCLQDADETHPAGLVEQVGEGVLIGYATDSPPVANSRTEVPSDALLLGLCRQAVALVSAQAAAPAAAAAPPDAPSPPASPPQRAMTVPPPIAPPPITTAPIAPAPAIVTGRPRRIVLIGNCQLAAMKALHERYVAPRTGDELFYVPSYRELASSGRDAIARADVIVEQLLDLPSEAADNLPAGVRRQLVPMVTAAFLWPFAGSPHPRNEALDCVNHIGPYGGEYSDSALNRMILDGKEPEAAVEAWLNLDVGARVNLDRLHELVMDRQRAREAIAGIGVSDIIERYFRSEPVFLSPYHPNTRVAVALASQLFERLGADPQDIARMRRCVHATPFPRDELPLHPAVCRHFGLDFVTPERTYRHLHEGRFTVREFALRYMAYTWNRDLAEGIHCLHQGRLEQARGKLVAALAQSPASASGHNALRHVHVMANEPEAALAAARAAVAAEPDAAIYHTNLAGQLHAMGHLAEAEAEFEAAIVREPTEPHHRILMAHLLRGLGRNAEALAHLRQAAESDPFSAHVCTQIEELGRMVQDARGPVDPADAAADVLCRQARKAVEVGALDDALEAANQAVRMRPRHAGGRRLRSDVLLRRGATREATLEALAAVVLEPRHVPGHVHLGIALRRAGDAAGAEAAFEAASALAPHDAGILHELSALLRQQKRHAEALAAAERAAVLEPEAPRCLERLAVTLMDNGRYEQAFHVLHRLLALAPENTEGRLHLSDLNARLGRFTEALAEVQVAVAREPKSVRALIHMAHVQRLRKEPAQAAETLRRALALEPGSAHLRQLLAALPEAARGAQAA